MYKILPMGLQIILNSTGLSKEIYFDLITNAEKLTDSAIIKSIEDDRRLAEIDMNGLGFLNVRANLSIEEDILLRKLSTEISSLLKINYNIKDIEIEKTVEYSEQNGWGFD
jgi:hypothetical protein